MNNYIEYNDRIAFHPGYYIKEIVEERGLTQRDFAKQIQRDPGIVFGRLQNDKKISYMEADFGNKVRHQYKILI